MIDYNAMSDADFRSEIRQFFETEYPEELRNLSHRLKILCFIGDIKLLQRFR